MASDCSSAWGLDDSFIFVHDAWDSGGGKSASCKAMACRRPQRTLSLLHRVCGHAVSHLVHRRHEQDLSDRLSGG